MIFKRLTVASVFLATVVLTNTTVGTAYVTVGYTPQHTDFSVSFGDETSTQKITPVFVLPGETIEMKIASDNKGATFAISELTSLTSIKAGPVAGRELNGSASWTWTAPQKVGSYTASIWNVATGASMDLRVFVMVPFSQSKTAINGYKIGEYPRISAAKRSQYGLPRGFVEVTAENKDLQLTPHFKLSQFLCKQQVGKFPQYVVLRERLLFKLEYVLEHVNKEGIPAKTF